jgi:LmbE family N-acetylglucosaminyl deacetylase
MINDIKFPFIRNKFPTTVKGELMSSFPQEQPIPVEYGKAFNKMRCEGGMCHGFLEGYFFMPYSLSIVELQGPIDKSNLGIVYSKTIEVLEEGLTEEEYLLVKDEWNKDIVKKRQKEIKKVEEMYDFEKTFKLDYPTAKLDTIPMQEIIESISKVILEIKPEIIYLPNRSDVHTDHQITFKAAYSCTKNFRYPFIKRILMYETLSETEFAPSLPENTFIPNVFVDITNYFKKKLEIFKIYKSEVMKEPYPRSIEIIESLAKVRGSRISKKYAEAFSILLDVI